MSPQRPTAPARALIARPPARYTALLPLVVDSSLICALLFDEPERDEASAQLGGRLLHAPNLLDHEVINVALVKRRNGWPERSVATALADYASYTIELHPTDPQAQYALAKHYGLSAGDAAYLWLAAELKAPLATFDAKLGAVAQRHLGALK